MNKGQLIRRKLNNGTPVGPYMCIERFTHWHVIAQNISRCPESCDDEIYIARRHVHEVNMFKLTMSENVWDRINQDRQNSIIHDICPTWTKMMNKEPEVVQIRAYNLPQKIVLFRVDQIKYVWYGREKQIRLDLGERIL